MVVAKLLLLLSRVPTSSKIFFEGLVFCALPTGRVEHSDDDREARQGRDGDGDGDVGSRRHPEPETSPATAAGDVGVVDEH